jgi:hypothetical protein
LAAMLKRKAMKAMYCDVSSVRCFSSVSVTMKSTIDRRLQCNFYVMLNGVKHLIAAVSASSASRGLR